MKKPIVEMAVGPYVLRTLERKDIEAVRLLRNSAREAFLRTEEITAQDQEAWYERYLLRDDDVLLVAERAGVIVGMAGLDGIGAEAVEFGRLVVAESERRKGLGFVLTAKLTTLAMRAGAQRVWLRVLVENLPARRLYESLGFVAVAGGDERIIDMQTVPADSLWDRPGVVEEIVSYWSAAHDLRLHRVWISDVVARAASRGAVLEVGCGSGAVYDAIRDLPVVASYTGLDTSRSMLSLAKVAHPSVSWALGDLQQLAPASADTVLCVDVLGHLSGDLVPMFRSLILAARDTAVVTMWTSAAGVHTHELWAGTQFPHNTYTHADVLAMIRAAAPEAPVVQHYAYENHVVYVIRRRRPDKLVHTVIVGSYNRPTYVREALRSVREQSYDRWQIIVTDDGSNDETLAAIREELGDDARCTLITQDRLPDGPRPGANVRAVERINDALPLVSGDIVHYLPDDDRFAPGRFEAFNAVFADPSVMVACGGMRYVDGAITSNAGIFPKADVRDPYCVLDQTQVAHRRECFAKVPRWPLADIAYAADGVFYRELCRAGYGPIRAMPALVSLKRRHERMLSVEREQVTSTRE